MAMTRAQEKLIPVRGPDGGGACPGTSGPGGRCPRPGRRPGAAAERGGLGAPSCPSSGRRRRACGPWPGGPEEIAAGLGPAWDIRWVQGMSWRRVRRSAPAALRTWSRSAGETEDLTAALTWTYPYEAAVSMPSKLTATQLKGRVLDQEAAQEGAEQGRTGENGSRRGFPSRTSWCRERGLTAAQRGTALHLAMQYLPLEETTARRRSGEELRRLTAGGLP